MPFALLHFIPILNANRAPNRNSLILMLALAVLVAFGAAWLLGAVEWQRRGRDSKRRSSRQETGSPALGITCPRRPPESARRTGHVGAPAATALSLPWLCWSSTWRALADHRRAVPEIYRRSPPSQAISR